MSRLILFWLVTISMPVMLFAQQSGNRATRTETRYVQSKSINVYQQPDLKSSVVGTLAYLEKITIERYPVKQDSSGVWLKLVAPVQGYIFQEMLVEGMSENDTGKTGVAASSSTDRDSSDLGPDGEESMESGEDFVNQRTIWWGLGVGLYILPEEKGYSSSIGDGLDVFADIEDNGSLISKFRFGLNISKSSSSNFSLATNSIYGAYKYRVSNFSLAGFNFYALGGLAFMMSSISKGVTASSSGIGLLLGAGALYDLSRIGLSDSMKAGFQYQLLSRQADFGSVKKYVGSNQIQLSLTMSF